MFKALIMVLAAGAAILGGIVLVTTDVMTGAAICSVSCATVFTMLRIEGVL